MNKNICIEEYIIYKNKLDNFITKEAETFYFRFLMEGIINESFMKEVSSIIDYVSNDISAKQINDLFLYLRDKTVIARENAEAETDPEKKMDLYLLCLSYFCLLEALNENSSFSTKIEQEIIFQLGSDALGTLAQIDKANLSVDGKKMLVQESTCVIGNQTIDKYLVMKRWQDSQREYSLVNIRPIYPIEEQYIGFEAKNLMHLHKEVLIKRAKIKLKSMDIIPIDIISKYYLAGIGNELIQIIGGKAYGLAVLNANLISIPETFVIPVNKGFNADVHTKLNAYNTNFAVRSSATLEDGTTHSFAGVFDSFLDVPWNKLNIKVKEVKKSISGTKAKSYINTFNLATPQMAVIIQPYIEPSISGVWIGSSRDTGYLEWIEGNGEKLVSGKETPHKEEWNNNTKEYGIKTYDESVGKQLLKIQQKINSEDNPNCMADFEWCVIENELIILQYRPVTKAIYAKGTDQSTILAQNENEIAVFGGIPVSPGEVKGNSKFVGRLSTLDSWNNGDILMAWFTDPDWINLMSKSSGLITAVGGLLCHAAIISRELGIPCVTGLGQNMKKIWNEKQIYLNGNTGIVQIEPKN